MQQIKPIHPLGAEIFISKIFSTIPCSEKWQIPIKQEFDIRQNPKLLTTYKPNLKPINLPGAELIVTNF